jgi:hypothetical protein
MSRFVPRTTDRTERVNFLLSKPERARLEEIARRRNQSISEVLRDWIRTDREGAEITDPLALLAIEEKKPEFKGFAGTPIIRKKVPR